MACIARTGPPGAHPDGTHTRWRRRTRVGSATRRDVQLAAHPRKWLGERVAPAVVAYDLGRRKGSYDLSRPDVEHDGDRRRIDRALRPHDRLGSRASAPTGRWGGDFGAAGGGTGGRTRAGASRPRRRRSRRRAASASLTVGMAVAPVFALHVRTAQRTANSIRRRIQRCHVLNGGTPPMVT